MIPCRLCKENFDCPRSYAGRQAKCEQTHTLKKLASRATWAQKKKARRNAKVVSEQSYYKSMARLDRIQKQKQDKGVTYNQEVLWSPPNIRERATLFRENALCQEIFHDDPGGGDWVDIDDEEPSDPTAANGNDIQGDRNLEVPNNNDNQGDDDRPDGDDGSDSDANDDEESAGSDDSEADFDEWNYVSPPKPSIENKWIAFAVGSGGGSEFKEPFVYNDNLPPYYVAQISLMKILSEHKENDIGIFDRIMDWVCHFSDKYPSIWKTRKQYRHHKRKSTLKFLSRYFDIEKLSPHPTNVKCSLGRIVTAPTYAFESLIEEIVHSPVLMKPENFLQGDFDPVTLRPTKHYNEYGPLDWIDDVHTGWLYHRGIDLYCNEEVPPGVDMVILLPLIFFCDEAQTSSFGDLSAEPVSFVPAWFRQECRMKYEFWRHLGYLPNMGFGHGKHLQQYDDEWVRKHNKKKGKKKDMRTSREKALDAQALYRAVIKSLKDCCERGGVRLRYMDKNCVFKPFLLAMITDAKGGGIMSGHYNASGNAKVNALCYQCLCAFGDLASTRPNCTRVTLAMLERARNDHAFAHRISYHPIASAWNEIPLANNTEGISGSMLFERLHVMGHGAYTDGPQYIHDFIGLAGAGAFWKEPLTLLFQSISADVLDNTERRIPRFAFRFGAMDLIRISGTEREGNYLLFAVCLTSRRGEEIMKGVVDEKKQKITRRNQKIIEARERLEEEKEANAENKKSSRKGKRKRDEEDGDDSDDPPAGKRTGNGEKKSNAKKKQGAKQKAPDGDNKGTNPKVPYAVLAKEELGKPNKISFSCKKTVDTMCLMPAFDSWCYGPKQKWELDHCENAVEKCSSWPRPICPAHTPRKSKA